MNQTPFLRTGCILEIAVPAEALTPLLNGADHRACIPLNDGISGSTVRVTRSHHVAIAVLRIGIPIGFRSFVVDLGLNVDLVVTCTVPFRFHKESGFGRGSRHVMKFPGTGFHPCSFCHQSCDHYQSGCLHCRGISSCPIWCHLTKPLLFLPSPYIVLLASSAH